MSTRTRLPRALVAALALGVTLAAAQGAQAVGGGDPARGKELSTPCQACHGADGNSQNPTFPRLAGQYASYLEHALEAYTTGERTNAIMQGFASTLSKQDRRDLAAWFSSQQGLQVLEGQR